MFGWSGDESSFPDAGNNRETIGEYLYDYDDLSTAMMELQVYTIALDQYVSRFSNYDYESTVYIGENMILIEFEIYKYEKGD